MEKKSSPQLITGNVTEIIIRMAIPMFFGIVGMLIFNLVDTFFIGQYGANDLIAISFTFPVVMVVMGISMGLGVGASAAVSRAIGEGNKNDVKRLTTDSLILSFLVVGFSAILGIYTIDPVFRLLGAENEIIPLIHEYMFIWYSGIVFVIIPMVGNSCIRATGDTKTPALVMIVSVIANIILDPLLIFGMGPFPEMGLAGAAIATLCARTITMIVALWVLIYRDNMISFEIPEFKTMIISWKKILYVGLPSAGTRIIMPVAMGILTGMIAKFGSSAVAGFGVATRIEFLSMIFVFTIGVVLGPFIGQNIGAEKYERVKEVTVFTRRFSLVSGFVSFLLLFIFSRELATIFTDNEEIISIISLYLRIVPVVYGFQGIVMLTTTTLNVMNLPFHGAALMICGSFFLVIPMSFLGKLYFGLKGIFVAITVGNAILGFIAVKLLDRQQLKLG